MDNQNQQTQTSQFPNQIPSGNNKSSGSKIVPIIIGVIVVLVAIGAYLLGTNQSKPVAQNTVQTTPIPSSTPDSTADRTTYTNTEYGFSISLPQGWNYSSKEEKVANATLVVKFNNDDTRMKVPIFIEEKEWNIAITDVQKNFKPETIHQTTFSDQPAIAIYSQEKEINPGYIFRIKHPKRNIILEGTASFIQGEDIDAFHSAVESILNSITFN